MGHPQSSRKTVGGWRGGEETRVLSI